MLTVGDKFPSFKLQAVVSREKGREIPTAVKANDVVRAQLATRVAAARAENARRLTAQRVTVRIPVEDR